MKVFVLIFTACLAVLTSCSKPNQNQIPKDLLLDKIKGGWAGQVIGCTYGGPTEFRYLSQIIPDDTLIPWDDTRMKWYFDHAPGLYDDVYMDLTFVEVFEKEGLNAPVLSHAKAFAEAEYKLWHANQAARYNILNGILPPQSGFWENNPHADDIDFQIEADFAGLMSPGMPVTASRICDSIGHIMNYGDGWYGGVYVATMYSLAFIENDIQSIVKKSLEIIPSESTFYQCIADVISWYSIYPDDWKQTWQACEEKWGFDIGCPDGVFSPFNIDAKMNAAYIVIGLLYGEGDYGKTIDISTRCGQDSDCNPANAAGILGTMIGYSNIPDYWKQGLDQIEHIDFKYTSTSLKDVYQKGFKQALENINANGGNTRENLVILPEEDVIPVKFEQAFSGHYPKELISIPENQSLLNELNNAFQMSFSGNGFVLKGFVAEDQNEANIDVFLDGAFMETVSLPSNFTTRRHEICWKYNLKEGNHLLEVKMHPSMKESSIQLTGLLAYTSKPD
jgi:hypothetical protein